jgi:hypothetical protein
LASHRVLAEGFPEFPVPESEFPVACGYLESDQFPAFPDDTALDPNEAVLPAFPVSLDPGSFPHSAGKFPDPADGPIFSDQAHMLNFPAFPDVSRFSDHADMIDFPAFPDVAAMPGFSDQADMIDFPDLPPFPDSSPMPVFSDHTDMINFPDMPALPEIGLKPDLAMIPSSSELPAFPNSELPAFPYSELPAFPDSELPAFSDSELPDFPNTELPPFPDSDLPDFPDSEFPAFPDPALPNAETMDTLPDDFPPFPLSDPMLVSPPMPSTARTHLNKAHPPPKKRKAESVPAPDSGRPQANKKPKAESELVVVSEAPSGQAKKSPGRDHRRLGDERRLDPSSIAVSITLSLFLSS